MNWNAPESIHLKNILKVEKKNQKASSITLTSVNKEKMMNWLLCHLQLSVGQENKSFCSKYNRAFQQAEWIWVAEDQLLASRKRNHRNSQNTMRRVQTSLTESMVYRSSASTWFSVLDIENDDPRIPQFLLLETRRCWAAIEMPMDHKWLHQTTTTKKTRALKKLVDPHFENLISRYKPYNLSTIKISSAMEWH